MELLKTLIASSLVDTGSGSGIGQFASAIGETFMSVMKIVMPIVLSVVLALGVFFSIKLGIAYAKTEKTEDREQAKKRLVGAVVGFGVGIIAAAVMWALFTNPTIINAIFK